MRAHKMAALTAVGMMLVSACGSQSIEAESPETATQEPTATPSSTKAERTTEPPGTDTDPVREAVESLYDDCQAEYVDLLDYKGLIEDPDSAINAGGRYDEDRSGMVSVFGNVRIDGSDEMLPWECTLSDGKNPGRWEIVFITHGESSPHRTS